MSGKEHFWFGITTGIVTGLCLESHNMALLGVTAGLGALLPDIDHPNSILGKLIYPVSTLLNKIFGHRTITHNALWVIPVGLILFYFNPYTWLLGLLIGIFGHLFLDSATKQGIPVGPWNFRLPFAKYVKSGGISSIIVTCFFTIIINGGILLHHYGFIKIIINQIFQ